MGEPVYIMMFVSKLSKEESNVPDLNKSIGFHNVQ